MSRANKDSERILSDIRHFQAMVSNETAKIKQDITQHIARRGSEETATEALVDRVAEHLAKLNARMQVVETVLASEIPLKREIADSMTKTIQAKPAVAQLPSLPKKLILNTQSFATNTNMGESELTDTGLSYCWTMQEPTTRFRAKVSRAQKMQARIRLVSVVKEDLKSDIKVLVDGETVPSRIMFDGTLDCLIADIPVAKNKADETLLAIQLPATYSPKELGSSSDERKLGIAINTIEFTEPQKKGLSRMFSRR
ncbi:hypothetical protein P7F88_22315 [Vibrio hannami]|uniref:hypothetical protein n=1 Tax=Vibrio hannami TaxID=2717094 RepID=UPI00240F9765|nr:hypothetical protein [Vibrio hannami]MDG3088646.1 hypothetical protein [Vibrio hannami]